MHCNREVIAVYIDYQKFLGVPLKIAGRRPAIFQKKVFKSQPIELYPWCARCNREAIAASTIWMTKWTSIFKEAWVDQVVRRSTSMPEVPGSIPGWVSWKFWQKFLLWEDFNSWFSWTLRHQISWFGHSCAWFPTFCGNPFWRGVTTIEQCCSIGIEIAMVTSLVSKNPS